MDSRHLPWTLWTVWTMYMDTLEKVHGHSGQLSMDSGDSLDIVHGHPGQRPGSPGGLEMSMDKVH